MDSPYIKLLTTVVVGVIAKIIQLILFNESDVTVPINYIIALLVAMVAATVLIQHYTKKHYLKKKRIFVISSGFSNTPFFSELIKKITHKLESKDYLPELKIPQEDFVFSEVDKHLNKILKMKDYYEGGIIIYSDVDNNYSTLKEFAESFKKPIVFVDSKKTNLLKDFPENTSFVGFDNEKTGKLAANCAKKLLKTKEIEDPKLLVLASKLQSKRQENFMSEINNHYQSCLIDLKDNGGFNRRKAYKIVYEKLKEMKASKERIFDLIFATNDEMAIGAIQAISDLGAYGQFRNIQIIGVDGIEEARDLIDKNDIYFMNTVNQSPNILAEESVKILFKKLNKKGVEKINVLEPEMYI